MPQLNGNTCEIDELPDGVTVTIRVTTNSRHTQKITVTRNDEVLCVFAGSGERNAMTGQSTVVASSRAKLQAKFEYQTDINAEWLKSRQLKSGGPYTIGSYNVMAIVAENGDDSDYNDGILELSWSTPA
ncbi:fucose-binding lectin II [Sorangium sp. So ce1078]|uniref:fucose-binding lectin II n=1 Tax=Sorangium sp. So ce1078 TaxID=3133329 RepID=UPI003F5FE5AE